MKWAATGLGFFSFFNVMADTAYAPWYQNIEGSIEIGPNWLNTNNRTVVISQNETDNVNVNRINNNVTWKAGVGYYLFDDYLKQRTYLNHLLFEVNVYQISGKVKGDVWQYQLTEFSNYNYQSYFKSTRLMLDMKGFLFTYKSVSPYLILGIGPAWNRLNYDENITGTGVPSNSNLRLGGYTTTRLAGDFGVGFNIPLTQQLSMTGEYIYALLGHAHPANVSSNGAELLRGPNFSFQTQSLLFGFNVRM